MAIDSPAAQLDAFIARYSPNIAKQVRAMLKTLRARLPGAVEMVYDNYYALVIGFCPVERASEVIVSLAVYPNHISLCFFAGDRLPDPEKLLQGSGKIARHIRLEGPAMLDTPAVRALIKAAIADSLPLDRKQKGRVVIAAVAKNPRPRRTGKS